MKCKNCGGIDFVKFGDHYECTCCGFPVSEDDMRKEQPESGNSNELESLTRVLKSCLSEPSIDETLVVSTANEIIKIEPDNVLANFFLRFVHRNLYPDNYKQYIASISNLELDDQVEGLLIPYMIDHSEYKFFDAITNMLIARGIYSKYCNTLFEAKKKLESSDEAYSDIPRDVFICYSSNDLETAESLASKIEASGNSCWYADHNMPKNSLSQTDYKQRIESAISKAKIFLVIMSSNSMLSDNVKWELDMANKYDIDNRIEYRIEKVENTTKFRLFFDGIQWIDAADGPQETVLLGRIYELLHPANNRPKSLSISIKEDEPLDAADDADKKITPSVKTSLYEDPKDEDETTAEGNGSGKKFVYEQTLYPSISIKTDSSLDDAFDDDFDDDEDGASANESAEETRPQSLNDKVLALFENEEYAEAFNILDQYDELPEDTENLVYYYIGYCFEKGYGTEIDEERKSYFYNLAKNNPPMGSNKDLGLCYFKLAMDPFMQMYQRDVQGLPVHVSSDNDGYDLLKKAADYGNADAMAYIGICFKYGLYVRKDLDEAFRWFSNSSDADSGIGSFHLGKCYEMGLGVRKDEILAFNAYKRSADLGNDKGMVEVGVCYYYGKGTGQSYEFAIKYYQTAAELGNTTALYNLAQCYLKGRGVEQDDNKALELMQKAAILNFKPAIEYVSKH